MEFEEKAVGRRSFIEAGSSDRVSLPSLIREGEAKKPVRQTGFLYKLSNKGPTTGDGFHPESPGMVPDARRKKES